MYAKLKAEQHPSVPGGTTQALQSHNDEVTYAKPKAEQHPSNPEGATQALQSHNAG